MGATSQMPGANPNDPPIGSINSNFPKEALDNIMSLYLQQCRSW